MYVATPHTAHVDGALLALDAGKPVLVEKPLATTADEARRIAEVASARQLFCMEAHWTTFLPKYDVLRQLLESGVLGDVVAVVADFGEWFPPEHRIFRADLAGGPMLDLGTYLINLVVNVMGAKFDSVVARSSTVDTGVVAQTAMIMTRGTSHAVLHTNLLADTPTGASIAGTEAGIVIDGPFYQPGGFTLTAVDGSHTLRYDEPKDAHEGGLHYQAAEVARRITRGDTQSTLHPLASSIDVLVVMDEVRCQTRDTVPADNLTT